MDHLAGARHVGHARELHPLDVAHHRHPRPAHLHGGSLTQSARAGRRSERVPRVACYDLLDESRRLVDMPPQALELALAASIYPPAVVAVIALGRGAQLRSRVVVFVLGAVLITYALGVLMSLVLDRTRRDRPAPLDAGGAFDLALGVALIGACRLSAPQTSRGDRHGHSRHRRPRAGPRKSSATWRAAGWRSCSASPSTCCPRRSTSPRSRRSPTRSSRRAANCWRSP